MLTYKNLDFILTPSSGCWFRPCLLTKPPPPRCLRKRAQSSFEKSSLGTGPSAIPTTISQFSQSEEQRPAIASAKCSNNQWGQFEQNPFLSNIKGS